MAGPVPQPLESAYDWRLPVAVSSVALVVGIVILAGGQVVGWLSAAVVLILCYAVYLAVVWRRTQAYLMVDGSVLTVRTNRAFHRIEGSELVKVTQALTAKGPSYRLDVRGADGRLARYGAPTALLRRGHSTLFGWILTWAPQAELDKGSRRTLQTLRDRGAVPGADDADVPAHPSHPVDPDPEQTNRD